MKTFEKRGGLDLLRVYVVHMGCASTFSEISVPHLLMCPGLGSCQELSDAVPYLP